MSLQLRFSAAICSAVMTMFALVAWAGILEIAMILPGAAGTLQ